MIFAIQRQGRRLYHRFHFLAALSIEFLYSKGFLGGGLLFWIVWSHSVGEIAKGNVVCWVKVMNKAPNGGWNKANAEDIQREDSVQGTMQFGAGDPHHRFDGRDLHDCGKQPIRYIPQPIWQQYVLYSHTGEVLITRGLCDISEARPAIPTLDDSSCDRPQSAWRP